MARLSDTQLVILTAAAQRPDGAILPIPDSIKARGAALAKPIEALKRARLIAPLPVPKGSTRNGAGDRKDAGWLRPMITRRTPCVEDAAIIEMVAAMREDLSLAGNRVELASGCLDRGQRDAALGALAGVEIDLADAFALQRSIMRIVRRRLGSPDPKRTFT